MHRLARGRRRRFDLQRMGDTEGVPTTASCLRAPVDGQALEGLVVMSQRRSPD